MTKARHDRVFRVLVAGMLAVCVAAPAAAEPDQGSIARGGKLYDKWYAVVKADPPAESHPLYPSSNADYADKPGVNWRCKECHGWDGMGAKGAYASGKHFTGIPGIDGKKGADPAEIVAILKAPAHGYADKLGDEHLMDLANFVVHGQVDWAAYLDGKTVKGDVDRGKQVYVTVCANCHGAEGKEPKDMAPLGSLVGNPWELMHKILNGQPAETMPGLRALDHQITADVVVYLATLPKQ